jgi:hypothetical protein
VLPPDPWTRHRSKLANAIKSGDREAAEIHRRDLAAARLADHVERVISTAPPMTDEQRDRIAAILRRRSS